ncbi:ATP-binding protein [Azospirillum sp.]|uniref:hybrid sensor histidine kinase/response regulator n=1 Tax=Azospirillum sp. TaxID=34012 RepID=UPI003D74AF99
MLNPRHLVFLVAAALLPVVLFTALVVAHYSGVERTLIDERLRATAATAAATVDRQLAREIAAVQTLATSESLQSGDIAAFDRAARRALGASGYWLSVILTDDTRQLVNTRLPFGAPLPVPALSEDLRVVLNSGRTIVSGLLRLPERIAEPVISIRAPVSVAGQVRHTLVVTLPAWTFHTVLGEHPTMPGGRLLLLDRDNRVIARTLSRDQYDPAVGSHPTPSQFAGVSQGPSGSFEADALDGTPVFGVYATAPLSGWKVLVGTPRSAIQEILRQAQWALYGGGALALALAVVLAQAMIRSFTRRQLAERRLADLQAEKATERRLGDIAANFPGVIFRRVLRPDGTVAYPYLSDAAERALGLEPGTVRSGLVDTDAVLARMTPETAERWTEAMARTARTLEPMRLEGELHDADGALRRLRTHATTTRLPDGTVVWDGVVLDVTDLHEAERAKREHAERLDFALDCANAGLWDWDVTTGRITWSNSEWRLFGYPAPEGEPTREHLERRLHPEDRERFWTETKASVAAVVPFASEFRVVDPNGQVRWLAAIGRTFADSSGRTVRMTGLNLDVTDRHAIEDALRDAKDEAERANVSKSKFLAAASHDLRQPVQSLLFFVHVLGERLAGHEAQPLVGTMHQALDALKGLLDGILDLSKLDAGVIAPRAAPFAVGPLLERLEAEYAPRFAAKRLDLTVVPCALSVDSDATLLGRILGNLLENALKYTERGGVLVGARRRGGVLRVEVWDTGIGIPPERLDDIFDEFVQVDNPARDRMQGLGLGLAIVRRLARLLGHRLEVRSRPGHGSVFAVEVPLSATVPRAVPPPPPSAETASGALAVIIDDDAIVLQGLRAMLETWDCAVIDAPDADTALRRAEAYGRRPDVVIADFRLREGHTGVEAIAALRRVFGAELPAILLTGDTAPALRAEATGRGLVTLHKPVPPAELHRLLCDLLRTPPVPAGRA